MSDTNYIHDDFIEEIMSLMDKKYMLKDPTNMVEVIDLRKRLRNYQIKLYRKRIIKILEDTKNPYAMYFDPKNRFSVNCLGSSIFRHDKFYVNSSFEWQPRRIGIFNKFTDITGICQAEIEIGFNVEFNEDFTKIKKITKCSQYDLIKIED